LVMLGSSKRRFKSPTMASTTTSLASAKRSLRSASSPQGSDDSKNENEIEALMDDASPSPQQNQLKENECEDKQKKLQPDAKSAKLSGKKSSTSTSTSSSETEESQEAIPTTTTQPLIGRIICKSYPGYQPSRGIVMSQTEEQGFKVKFEDGYIDFFEEAELRELLDMTDCSIYQPPRRWFRAQRNRMDRTLEERLRHSVDQSNIIAEQRRRHKEEEEEEAAAAAAAAAAAGLTGGTESNRPRSITPDTLTRNSTSSASSVHDMSNGDEALTSVHHRSFVLQVGSYVFAVSSRGEERPAQIIGLYAAPARSFYTSVRWLRFVCNEDGSPTAEVIPTSGPNSVVSPSQIVGLCRVVSFSEYCAIRADICRRRALGEPVSNHMARNLLWTHMPCRLGVS